MISFVGKLRRFFKRWKLMKSHMTDLSNECASRSKESKDTTSKKSFRVIPRDQWANIGLEPNVTDLEQLETPLQAGVVGSYVKYTIVAESIRFCD